ncbi:MAG TPA: lysophospholipid acyltransferase family protein [Candidatus Syntrophosphaera sp.]|nr:lysophospholipid acyltransferase family protein [Candidatus Syntrophosphaera sp.]HRQ66994.1 lysophospholipid acyltransferase family protein [Candidatus Syntrophosphaera sp.]
MSPRLSLKRNNLVNRTEYLLFRFALFKLRLLPYPWGRWLLTRLFLWIGYGLGIRRQVAAENLQRVYPDMPPKQRKKLLKRVYLNLGLSAAELYLLPEKQLISGTSINGRENLEAALALGKGVILATAHLGNWEAARTLPLFGIPLAAVVQKQHNHLFDAYNNALRTRQGVRLIDQRHGLKDLLACLRQNMVVTILTDQNAGPEGLILEFLGHPAPHWKGAAKISLRYKAPIIPGYALRNPEGGIRICFEPMIHHPELSDSTENQLLLLKEINAVTERYIRQNPKQWLWLHRRWLIPERSPLNQAQEIHS